MENDQFSRDETADTGSKIVEFQAIQMFKKAVRFKKSERCSRWSNTGVNHWYAIFDNIFRKETQVWLDEPRDWGIASSRLADGEK